MRSLRRLLLSQYGDLGSSLLAERPWTLAASTGPAQRRFVENIAAVSELMVFPEEVASTSKIDEVRVPELTHKRNGAPLPRKSRLDIDKIPMLQKSACVSSDGVHVRPRTHWQHAVERHHPEPPLLDKHGRQHTYLRISLTERCNLRCVYCMPEDGMDLTPKGSLLSTSELVRLAQVFVTEGISKIRLTGGEPTIRRDIIDITASLSQLQGLQTLAMTTNGLVVGRLLGPLRAAGLSALNISLDTLQPRRFEQITRRQGLERVVKAIYDAVAFGFSVKVNVVPVRGCNDDELSDFVRLTKDLPINVRFIEYMPFDDNGWTHGKMYTYQEMKDDVERDFGPLMRCSDPHGEVAKNFTLPSHAGSVSFISSMTEHFCSECTRLRLMADGNLKVCLFGANEVSLRDALRDGATDEEIRCIIGAAVRRKRKAHADVDVLAATRNRAMTRIGG